MFAINRTVIGENERGLMLKNRRFKRVLEPGVYWFFDPFGRVEVKTYVLDEPRFVHRDAEVLIKQHPELVSANFTLADLGAEEVGLVYLNGKLADILAPDTRQLYWKGPVDVRIEKIDISENFSLAPKLARTVTDATDSRLRTAVKNAVALSMVPDKSVGLLFVDQAFVKTLDAGRHAFWRFNRMISVDAVDLRVQAMEVSGQEILTRDKVSLRINLAATYQVTDAVKARSSVKDYADFLYRELQFALRQAVGTRTLDALLADKRELDDVIATAVSGTVANVGITLLGTGVKDIILPGDMKTILNQVVEAEKAAQANVIKRREETAATRSLLNTAKLMDDNPTLLRLKELEVLEKVTEKVDRLTVFGGLDGVLKDTVRIKVDA